MYTTDHQYLAEYPIDRTATKLILGTIHPHRHEKFQVDFFYGNELSLWKIFNKAFPKELPNPANKRHILDFLTNRRIAISDTILQCERESLTALDDKLNITIFNDKILLEAIENSSITEVLCTSGFGKNNAFKIFYNEILKMPITKSVQQDREVIYKFSSGKEVKIKAMYSPARTAIRGIGNSKGFKEVEGQMTVDEYRVGLYKAAVS